MSKLTNVPPQDVRFPSHGRQVAHGFDRFYVVFRPRFHASFQPYCTAPRNRHHIPPCYMAHDVFILWFLARTRTESLPTYPRFPNIHHLVEITVTVL